MSTDSKLEALNRLLGDSAEMSGWRKEADDTDALLRHLGLDPDACRTEAGWLNLPHIKTLLAEQEQAGEAVGEIKTITGTPGFPHSPYNAPVWADGMQPPPGTKLFTHPQQPLSDEQIEKGREATFSTSNPFCPCDSKTMRKAVRWAERAHGIGITKDTK